MGLHNPSCGEQPPGLRTVLGVPWFQVLGQPALVCAVGEQGGGHAGAAPTLGDTTLMSSLRKRNLPTSSWKRLPQLFMHVSSTCAGAGVRGSRGSDREAGDIPRLTGTPRGCS